MSATCAPLKCALCPRWAVTVRSERVRVGRDTLVVEVPVCVRHAKGWRFRRALRRLPLVEAVKA